MGWRIQITDKTDYYVTVITTPSLQKLPVIQLGNKIHHRLFRKTKLRYSVPSSATLQCTQTYEIIPHLLNIYLRSILIISRYLRHLLKRTCKQSSTFDGSSQFLSPSKNFYLKMHFQTKPPSPPSPTINFEISFFKVDWIRPFVSRPRAECKQK